MNLASRILTTLSSSPQSPALTTLGPSGTPLLTHSHADILARAAAWATRIRMSGVLPGTAIAVALGRDIDLAAVHTACLAAGTPIVPINTALAERELLSVLAAAEPALVIAEPAFAESRAELARRSGCEWWLTGPSDLADREPFSIPDLALPGALTACPTRGDAVALLLFTSGTTGRAKSVPLSHDNLTSNLTVLARLWARSPSDRLLHMLPAHHFHGLVLALYGSLACGNEILLLPRFDARAALDVLGTQRCNVVMGVPTMYARMIDAAQAGDRLPRDLRALCGSAPLAAKTFNAFDSTFGVKLIERYGLTETCIVATNPIESPRAASVGRPLPGTDVSLYSDGRYAGGPEDKGEICVRSPSVTEGYGNDDDANVDAFRDGWFHTGDIGRLDADGFLWIEGRLKELIIVGGSNVIPGEVERALEGVAGVAELAAGGVPHEDLGEVVVAYVAAEHDDHTELERSLRATAEESLSAYKRPRQYVFVDTLPRNAMGKIDRSALSAIDS